jgi:putative hemolysin
MKMLGIAASAMLVAGCANPDDKPQSVGMPNPASAYCVQIGGKLGIENREGGQVGICTLPDGTRIEEWELYRRDHPQK